MQAEPSNYFLKRLAALRDEALRGRLREIVRRVESAETPHDIPNIKKLKGHPSAYRIRSGDYRVVVHIEGDTVVFTDFDHRRFFI